MERHVIRLIALMHQSDMTMRQHGRSIPDFLNAAFCVLMLACPPLMRIWTNSQTITANVLGHMERIRVIPIDTTRCCVVWKTGRLIVEAKCGDVKTRMTHIESGAHGFLRLIDAAGQKMAETRMLSPAQAAGAIATAVGI